MSYFAARIGRRPLAPPRPVHLRRVGSEWYLAWPAPPGDVSLVALLRGEREPLPEVARLPAGERGCLLSGSGGPLLSLAWVRGEEVGAPAPAVRLPGDPAGGPPPACPLCQGLLEWDEGIGRCSGRCNKSWLEEQPGSLLDITLLPCGLCDCCRPPRALFEAAHSLLCPHTLRPHLLLPGGRSLLRDRVEHFCTCCEPPMPLLPAGAYLYCAAKPHQRYRQVDMQVVPEPPAGPGGTFDAIDEALRKNSARLTIHGLFDL